MELGRCLLKRTTGNTLKNAFHPVHGLLWTDGSSVYHTPSSSLSGHCMPSISDGTPHKLLGQFGQVHGISWSSSVHQPMYVSVISQPDADANPEMSLWRVETVRPGIQLSQVANQPLESPPLPHGAGCVWHPQEDRVCIIGKTAATVWAVCEKGREVRTSWHVSSGQSQRGHSFSSIKNKVFRANDENINLHHIEDTMLTTTQSLRGSRFTCGTWDLSGTQLVLATESKLLFFSTPPGLMEDLESQCALIIGRVSCIESIDEGKFLCTVDLPLDGLVCNLSTEKEGAPPADDTTSQGALEELLNVHHNLDSPVTASSQLVIVSWLQDKPQIINRIVISGMLAPDLLAWEGPSSTCVVGSNSSSILQAYTIIRDTMAPSKEIMLQDSKRPKGVAIHNQEVWLMVGETAPSLYPPLSIPTTEYSEYSVILQMTPGLPAHPPGLDEELAQVTHSYRNSCDSLRHRFPIEPTNDPYFPPSRAPHRTSSGKAISEQAGISLPPPTAHSLTNLVHIANAVEDPRTYEKIPFHQTDHATMVPSDYLKSGSLSHRTPSRTPDDCHTNFVDSVVTKPSVPPKKFNSTSLKVHRRRQQPISNLSNSLDSKRFPSETVEFMKRGVVATTSDMAGPLEVAQSLESDDEVAFRLTRIEQCLVDLSSRQSQELREIKSEMATTKQLLTSVFLQLLPGEVRKEVITAVSEEFKEEVLELKDTIKKNMSKTEDISAEIQADLVRCKTEIDMLKDQLRDLEGRKEYQY